MSLSLRQVFTGLKSCKMTNSPNLMEFTFTQIIFIFEGKAMKIV